MRLEAPTPGVAATLLAPRRPRRGARAATLTPLIDVVFILLLFFMLATSFGRWGTLEITPAGARGAASTAAAPTVLVRLRAASIDLSGETLAAGALAARLRGLHDRHPGLAIVLDVDPGVPLQRVVDTLETIGDAGVPAPMLRTPPPPGINR